LQGMRSKAELVAVKQMLQQRRAALLPITETITQRAIALMEALTLSHGRQLGDALIAATALELGLPVLTANTKHFEPVEGLAIEVFRI
ncbi:MAG: PIN domain-containing protein, partial [bacterium]